MKNLLKKLTAFALAVTLTAVPMNFTDFTADNSTTIVANAKEESVTIATKTKGKKSYEKDGIKITGDHCDGFGFDIGNTGSYIRIEAENGSKIKRVDMYCRSVYQTTVLSHDKLNITPSCTISGTIYDNNTVTLDGLNTDSVEISTSYNNWLQFNSFTVYYEKSDETATLAELFENQTTCGKKDLSTEVTITEENDKKIYTIGDDTYTLNKLKKMAFHDYAYRILEYVEPTENSDGYYVREKYCKTCGEGKGRNTVKICK